MLFAELTQVSARVAATRGRNEKIRALAEALKRAPNDEVPLVVTYLSGGLPQRKTGVGYASVRKLERVPPAEQPSLGVREVDARIEELSGIAGSGAAVGREQALGALFARATREEQSFLAALLIGGLRQGSLEGLMADAIAQASGCAGEAVRRAGMLAGELGLVAQAALAEGAAGLVRFKLQLFRPVQPMLAQTAADVDEAIADLGESAFEHKLDGARVQVHKEGDLVKVYSRDGNEVTQAVPEVVELVRALPAKVLVLDGEAVALRSDGTPQPFQVTMRRFGRKTDVAAARQEQALSPFFFDVLHLDGQDLLEVPWRERVVALDAKLPATARVTRLVTASAEEADAFYAEALRRGQEGLLAKSVSAGYEAGRRGAAWRKLKPAHALDLVVLAVEWGSGRREGWLSNLHLGAREPATGGFVMLGKTFKGMTDAMLQWQTEKLKSLELSTDGHVVHVKPELVVEIAFDSVQESPHYPGGMALRFARVKRYREDKRADEADTLDAVRAIFQKTHRSASAQRGSD